jgi:hypothetical protein
MPKVEPLLVHSERALLEKIYLAFGGKPILFPDSVEPIFTDLVSAGLNENLLSVEHSARLTRLGYLLLGITSSEKESEIKKLSDYSIEGFRLVHSEMMDQDCWPGFIADWKKKISRYQGLG